MTETTHKPNPFDFVPFADNPIIKPEEFFDQMGDLLSGYLEFRIRALTPVHIVGYQNIGADFQRSYQYRQSGQACIPAASIRGCLRAFMEALTAGWVSQATSEYPYEHGKRHRGFATFEKKPSFTDNPAIDPAYQPQVKPGAAQDVASYLFGLVIEKQEGSGSKHEDLARKSRIIVEDAYFSDTVLDDQSYWMPGMNGTAFMGGAKASASSWWYMRPHQIIMRDHGHGMAEFIGEKFRGRKFYFHQDPQACVELYRPGKWLYRAEDPFCEVRLECLKPEQMTAPFRIYINRVPRKLLMLFVLCLLPGNHIRHKIGYGKAYGFGSIEFNLQSTQLRSEPFSQRIPLPLTDYMTDIQEWLPLAWNVKKMQAKGMDTRLIDWSALNQLALILSWDRSENIIFTYPPYISQNFKQAIQYDKYQEVYETLRAAGQLSKSTVIERLYYSKRTIDFRLYQERSDGWDRIKNRRP